MSWFFAIKYTWFVKTMRVNFSELDTCFFSQVSTGSGDDMSVRSQQAIIWIDADWTLLCPHLLKSNTKGLWMNAFNSSAPGRFQFNLFRLVIFKLTLVNGGWGISYEIALRWMPLDLTDDKSTLVQVMTWCCQTTSHYLSQCWPKSMSPNGVTRPQWVNS